MREEIFVSKEASAGVDGKPRFKDPSVNDMLDFLHSNYYEYVIGSWYTISTMSNDITVWYRKNDNTVYLSVLKQSSESKYFKFSLEKTDSAEEFKSWVKRNKQNLELYPSDVEGYVNNLLVSLGSQGVFLR